MEGFLRLSLDIRYLHYIKKNLWPFENIFEKSLKKTFRKSTNFSAEYP